MEWLNYHHLLYFWMVVREGGLAKAATRLRLSHPTVSAQVHALEEALGEALLVRKGRGLELTEMGQVVFRYADEIFALGTELLDTVKSRPTGRPLRLVVGVADVVPKLVARRLIAPVLRLAVPVSLVCREGKAEHLIAALATHDVDVVLSDTPVPAGSGVRAFNHLLGESGTTWFAAPGLAERLTPEFPRSLDGAPVLLPSPGTHARRTLDTWLATHGLTPRVVASFDDSALLDAFGEDGLGAFAAPTAIEAEVVRQHAVSVIGRAPEVRERLYAISTERRVRHPGVAAMCDGARETLG